MSDKATNQKRIKAAKQEIEAAAQNDKPIVVEVLTWPMSPVDVGHSAIRIGNYVFGYYPTDVNGDGRFTKVDLHKSPGDLHVDTIQEARQLYQGDKICIQTLQVSLKQAQKMLDFFAKVNQKPGIYALISKNCTTHVREALNHGGVDNFEVTTYLGEKAYLLVLNSVKKIKKVHCLGGYTVVLNRFRIIAPPDLKNAITGKKYLLKTTEETVK